MQPVHFLFWIKGFFITSQNLWVSLYALWKFTFDKEILGMLRSKSPFPSRTTKIESKTLGICFLISFFFFSLKILVESRKAICGRDRNNSVCAKSGWYKHFIEVGRTQGNHVLASWLYGMIYSHWWPQGACALEASFETHKYALDPSP